MKKSILSLLLAVLALTLAKAENPATDWAFTTDFPARPSLREYPPEDQSIVLSESHVGVTKGTTDYVIIRLVAYFAHPPRDLTVIYKTLRDVMHKERPSTVIEEESIKLCDLPAYRYIIASKDGKRKVEVREVCIKAYGEYENYLFAVDYDAHKPLPPEGANFFARIRRNLSQGARQGDE